VWSRKTPERQGQQEGRDCRGGQDDRTKDGRIGQRHSTTGECCIQNQDLGDEGAGADEGGSCGGERLHHWSFDSFGSTGSQVVVQQRRFDDEPYGYTWSEQCEGISDTIARSSQQCEEAVGAIVFDVCWFSHRTCPLHFAVACSTVVGGEA
jgi:hypothetical protein